MKKIIIVFGLTCLCLIVFPQDTDKWGYIDKTGKIVIEPQFDYSAESFSEGLASIYKNSKYGYIDKTGKIVIEPQFESAENFSEGLARISKEFLGKYGYVDKTGKIVIEPHFEGARNFSEGLALIGVDGKYGYIDKSGKIIIQPQFNFGAESFSEGLARIYKNSKYGYIDKTGEIIIEPQFNHAESFSEGLARINKVLLGKYCYIDKTGKIVVEQQFDDAEDFSEGLAAVEIDGKYGYIDKTGKIIIEPQFNHAKSFSEDLALVYVSGKWGYIDKTGKIVIEPQFKDAKSFSEGLACIKNSPKLTLRELVADIQANDGKIMSEKAQQLYFNRIISTTTRPQKSTIIVASLGDNAKEAIPVLIEKFPQYIDITSSNDNYNRNSNVHTYNEYVEFSIYAQKLSLLDKIYYLYDLDKYIPYKELEQFCFFEPKVNIQYSRTGANRYGENTGIEYAEYTITISSIFNSGAYTLSKITGHNFGIKQEDWFNWWKTNKNEFIFDILQQRRGIDLKNLPQEKKVDILITFLQDWNSGIRWTIAMMLGEMKDSRAVDSLIFALKDQNDYVRKYSVIALGEIGGTKAKTAIEELINDKNEEVRQAVQSILQH